MTSLTEDVDFWADSFCMHDYAMSPVGHPCLTPPVCTMNAAKILPNELWDGVFDYLGKKDLKALRLTGDIRLGRLASSRLFIKAYLAARKGVCDIFEKLLDHPTLRYHVRELIYDSSWIDAEIANERSKRADALQFFQMFAEQEQLQAYELQILLNKAFKTLPHLRKVIFADMSRTTPIPGDLADQNAEPLSGRLFSHSWSTRVGSCCIQTETPARCCGRYSVFWRQHGGFVLLVRALTRRAEADGTMLQELTLGDGLCSGGGPESATALYHYSNGIPDIFFGPSSRPLLIGLAPHFQCLRKLDISISCFSMVKSDNNDAPPVVGGDQLSSLTELLGLAGCLEELKLSGEFHTANLDMAVTFGLATMKRLRVLDLRCFEARYVELKHFLIRHGSSLRTLELDDFNLVSGTWRGLVEFIQQDLPKLDAYIGFVWHNGLPSKAYRVLKGDTLEGNGHDDSDEEYRDNYSDNESFGYTQTDTSEELEYSSQDDGSDRDIPQRRNDISITDIEDLEMRYKVNLLRTSEPHRPLLVYKIALEQVHGDYGEALGLLRSRLNYQILPKVTTGL